MREDGEKSVRSGLSKEVTFMLRLKHMRNSQGGEPGKACASKDEKRIHSKHFSMEESLKANML